MPTDLTRDFRVDAAALPDEEVIFGSTSAMREIRKRIDAVLSADLPVLIQGESGTGKEVIARYLHARSNRSDAPFVRLNCAAVPAGLLESELFGYQKGSFAEAREDRPGLIEIADRGTLFLDEIGELDKNLQSKLLRFLQDGMFSRIGGHQQRSARIRVICATNVDLQGAVEKGAFREDLFRRVHLVSLHLVPLRNRREDIPRLCEYFLRKLARQFGRNAPRLDTATLRLLMQWNWPGNLRELENWIARAIILGDTETLGSELRRRLGAANYREGLQAPIRTERAVSPLALSPASNATILRVLRANRWNRRKTAVDLKMSYRTLRNKLLEAGIVQRRRSHGGFPL